MLLARDSGLCRNNDGWFFNVADFKQSASHRCRPVSGSGVCDGCRFSGFRQHAAGMTWCAPQGGVRLPHPGKAGKKSQKACKPGSVPLLGVTVIHLGRRLPDASSDRPGKRAENRPCGYPRAFPIWSCSRWGLPSRFRYRKRGALLPHLFTLTGRPEPAGGLLSVALAVTKTEISAPGRYPAPCFQGARTFLPFLQSGDRPAFWLGGLYAWQQGKARGKQGERRCASFPLASCCADV
jgi:hypothetical protein